MKKQISKHLFELVKSPLSDAIVGTVFSKFSKILPVKKIKENDKDIAFWHPKPFWEKHIVIVPKKAIRNIQAVSIKDEAYIAEIFIIAGQLVEELNLEQSGYTLTINGGKRQEVEQLHVHLHAGNTI